MAVHRKFHDFVDELSPDVAVIAECASPDVLRRMGLDVDQASMSASVVE